MMDQTLINNQFCMNIGIADLLYNKLNLKILNNQIKQFKFSINKKRNYNNKVIKSYKYKSILKIMDSNNL